MHIKGEKGKIIQYTRDSWTKVVNAAKIWLEFGEDSDEKKIIAKEHLLLWSEDFQVVDGKYGYHSMCQSIFTHKVYLERTRKKRLAQDAIDSGSDSPASILDVCEAPTVKRTRSSVARIGESRLGVLAKKCLICKKERLNYRHKGAAKYQKLTQCTTLNAGKLWNEINYGKLVILNTKCHVTIINVSQMSKIEYIICFFWSYSNLL